MLHKHTPTLVIPTIIPTLHYTSINNDLIHSVYPLTYRWPRLLDGVSVLGVRRAVIRINDLQITPLQTDKLENIPENTFGKRLIFLCRETVGV